MTTPTNCALIIGSGFPAFTGEGEGRLLQTRFGNPTAPIHTISIEDSSLLSIRRHGDNHSTPPHAINYRANLAALQELGTKSVIALNTVGVISHVREPGQIALPDQILDYTWGREHTIFDGADNCVEHIDFTVPFSSGLRSLLLTAARSVGVDCYDGGVYAATQGPRLESAAEIDRLENDGADYVGMTAMPEASLAMEFGLDYVCLALIVNSAAGRGDTPIHQDVDANTHVANGAAMSLLREFFATGLVSK